MGTALAHTLLSSVPSVRRITLVDTDEDAAEAEAEDLSTAAVLLRRPVSVSAGIAASAGSDILVLSVGARDGSACGRGALSLAKHNAGIARLALPPVAALSPSALIVVLDDPVDVLCSVVSSLLKAPPGRVLGSGAALASARLSQRLAARTGGGVDPRSVVAPLVGEHGDSAVPLWGASLVGFAHAAALVPSLEERAALVDEARAAGCVTTLPMPRRRRMSPMKKKLTSSSFFRSRIVARKGTTSWGTAAAAASLISSILTDSRSVAVVSAPLQRLVSDGLIDAPTASHGAPHPAAHGGGGATLATWAASLAPLAASMPLFLSVPCVIGRSGILALQGQFVYLSPVEQAELSASADALREAAAGARLVGPGGA